MLTRIKTLAQFTVFAAFWCYLLTHIMVFVHFVVLARVMVLPYFFVLAQIFHVSCRPVLGC